MHHVHDVCTVVTPSYNYYLIINNLCSFCEEGKSNELMHIAATDDAEPADDLYEKFQAACDFISKLHIC